MKRWLLSLSLAACFATLAPSALALPTVNDVQAQVQKGNYTGAQTMMREVVEARPSSAKAHYIYAEILAHNARFADAAEQVRIAKELDPAVKFADPDKFRSFEALLDREQQRGAAPPPVSTSRNADAQRTPTTAVAPATRQAEAPAERSAGVPVWVWIGIAVVGFGAWRLMRNNRAAPAMAGGMGAAGPYPNAGPQASYGPGPGYGPGYGNGGLMQQQGRGGSGMLGTGLAAAGGVAAGMMAEKWLSGQRDHGAGQGNLAGEGAAGGNAFNDAGQDDAARQLESRDVDFGSGNDWDSGGSDGGSFDTGGSGGGDDW